MTLIDAGVHALVLFAARVRRMHFFNLILVVVINWPLVDFIACGRHCVAKQILVKDAEKKPVSS